MADARIGLSEEGSTGLAALKNFKNKYLQAGKCFLLGVA
jgi:hypothetical protein